MKGSPPKRRSVLPVFDWSAEIIADWLERGHRHRTDGLDLFPSERGTLVSETALNRRFNRYCEDLGLPRIALVGSPTRATTSQVPVGQSPAHRKRTLHVVILSGHVGGYFRCGSAANGSSETGATAS
jgi:hypothetical protein